VIHEHIWNVSRCESSCKVYCILYKAISFCGWLMLVTLRKLIELPPLEAPLTRSSLDVPLTRLTPRRALRECSPFTHCKHFPMVRESHVQQTTRPRITKTHKTVERAENLHLPIPILGRKFISRRLGPFRLLPQRPKDCSINQSLLFLFFFLILLLSPL
jgi:hypothetical protein